MFTVLIVILLLSVGFFYHLRNLTYQVLCIFLSYSIKFVFNLHQNYKQNNSYTYMLFTIDINVQKIYYLFLFLDDQISLTRLPTVILTTTNSLNIQLFFFFVIVTSKNIFLPTHWKIDNHQHFKHSIAFYSL